MSREDPLALRAAVDGAGDLGLEHATAAIAAIAIEGHRRLPSVAHEPAPTRREWAVAVLGSVDVGPLRAAPERGPTRRELAVRDRDEAGAGGERDRFAAPTVAKALGALALLIPATPPRIKEFAYFGFAITLISASIAHLSSGDSIALELGHMTVFFALVVSYVYDRKARAPDPGT
jgi:hypothetical protein